MRAALPALLLLALLPACQTQPVVFQPGPVESSQLAEQHRLVFERTETGWLRTEDGQNLAKHNVISDPSVLWDDGRYRMWFTAARHPYTDEQELGTAYAESSDGRVWRPRYEAGSDELALLLRPTPGGWDEGGVETPNVVRRSDGSYLLYYTGTFAKDSNRWAIGAATSPDGITWTKVGDGPVFAGAGNWEGPFQDGQAQVGGVLEPSVVYRTDDGRYQMWYSGLGDRGGTIAFRIGYAESQDGISWTSRPEPVLEPQPGAWDSAVVSHGDVLYLPGAGYHLFYFGASAENYQMAEANGAAMIPGSIGHAYSSDGLRWEKDANPVLTVVPDTWEAWMVGGPSALARDGGVWLWYFASGAHNTFEFHMGLATGSVPRP